MQIEIKVFFKTKTHRMNGGLPSFD